MGMSVWDWVGGGAATSPAPKYDVNIGWEGEAAWWGPALKASPSNPPDNPPPPPPPPPPQKKKFYLVSDVISASVCFSLLVATKAMICARTLHKCLPGRCTAESKILYKKCYCWLYGVRPPYFWCRCLVTESADRWSRLRCGRGPCKLAFCVVQF